MKDLIVPISVFLLIIFLGIAWLSWKQHPVPKKKPEIQPQKTESLKGILPPLNLPDEKKIESGEDSWEYSGEIGANFVSAKTKLTAKLLYLGWRPKAQITISETLSPQIILTFKKESVELLLMLWKINTNTTGFSYKRDKIINSGIEIK